MNQWTPLKYNTNQTDIQYSLGTTHIGQSVNTLQEPDVTGWGTLINGG